MNKKSVFLLIILLGGLLTPHQTKPVAGIVLAVVATIYGAVLLNTFDVPIDPIRTKNNITDYTREQVSIREYKAQLQIYTREKKNTLFTSRKKILLLDTIISATSPENFIAAILQHIKKFNDRLEVTIYPTLILHSDKVCPLRKISIKKFQNKSLIKKIERTILVEKNKKTVLSYIIRGLFLSTALFVVPLLWISFLLEKFPNLPFFMFLHHGALLMPYYFATY